MCNFKYIPGTDWAGRVLPSGTFLGTSGSSSIYSLEAPEKCVQRHIHSGSPK